MKTKKTHRLKHTFLSIAIFIANVLLGQASIQNKDIIPKIEEVINKAVELELFSGVVLVAKNGKILFSQAYGEANKDFHIKNKLNTKFNVCSITKPFTSMSIMLLAQSGLLKINDPVIKYLPDFPFGEQITIYHLLTHTAGLGDYESNPEYISKMFSFRRIDAILPIIYKEKLLFETPGQKMSYSNSGAVVLGAIIEKISKIPYADFLKKNIFQPLKMNNTISAPPKELVENRAIGYMKKMSGGFISSLYDVIPASSATGLTTTVGDLLLFDQALYKSELLKDEYKKIMFTPYINRYACLWGVTEKYNNTLILHSGGQPGFSAWFRRYINDRYTIIVLSNYNNGTDHILPQIEAILFSKDYILPRLPVGELLYFLIKKDGIDNVVGNISNILEKNNYQIPNSGILNDFGYDLLNTNDPDMAIKVFLLNTILFKDDANNFNSLAEAYLNSGNKELAIENYEKSLKLDPNNQSTIDALKLLKINK